jgi:cbb3-type cytochrome oxidase maturation protein
MSAIYILIIASLMVASGFLIAFLWAVKSGQFEDKYTPSIRIILDEKNGSVEDISKNESEEK